MKWLVVFAGLVSMALAYKVGPPLADYPGVCGTMTPNHTADAKTTASPFEITLDSTCYKKDTKITVSVKSKAANSTYYFEGMMVQVRKPNDATASYGVFAFDSAETHLQLHDCFTSGMMNTITHKNGEHFFSRNFTWTAPDDSGELEFVGTVVHETEDYWVGIKSSKITFSATCADTTGAASYMTASALLLALVSFALLL